MRSLVSVRTPGGWWIFSAFLSAALAAKYEILREIGWGGMSVVVLARDLSLYRGVALKVSRPEHTASVGAGCFLREIQFVVHFEHTYLFQLHESRHGRRSSG